MSKALFIRTAHGLMPDPDDNRSRDILKGVPLGTLMEVETKRPRNIQFHRLYWKLCSVIAESVPGFNAAEEVSDVLKIATGHCTVIKGKADLYRLPKSISFAKMEEPEFRAFFDSCCRVICEGWIKHMKADALRDDVMRMVGISTEGVAA